MNKKKLIFLYRKMFDLFLVTGNRVVIVLFCMGRSLLRRFFKNRNSRKVVIFFPQQIGDGLLFVDSLNRMVQHFIDHDYEGVMFTARPSVNKFLHDVADLHPQVELIDINMEKLMGDFRYYYLFARQYLTHFDVLLVPNTSVSAELVTMASLSSQRIGMTSSLRRRVPFFLRDAINYVYNDLVIVDQDIMELKRYQLLLQHLGIEENVLGLPHLIKQKRMIEGHYCVVSLGASLTEKIWPVTRFVDVINFIINNSNLNVHICGVQEDVLNAAYLQKYVQFPDRVISHVGATNFKEWVSIIQYADFVFGNDSASIHIAAASKVASLCICGCYDKNQFFPYQAGEIVSEDQLPIVVRKDQACAYCRAMGNKAGYGNKKCSALITAGHCASCIDQISVNDVIRYVKELLDRGYSNHV